MKTLLTLIVVLMTLNLTAQEKLVKRNKINNKVSSVSASSWLKMSGLADKDQTMHIVKCLDNYRQERATAISIGIVGLGLAAITPTITDKNTKDIMIYSAAGVGVISALVFLNAEKWISAKKLLIAPNGVTFRF
jgi:hypothetical protein